MGGKDPKITAIFLAGSMKDLEQHYHDIDRARDLYPWDRTYIEAHAEKPIEDVLSFTPVSKADLLKYGGRTIRNLGKDDILHFVQFGHGDYGPSISLRYDRLIRYDFVDLFTDNINTENPPQYVAIIMGGCFSGGFAKYFFDGVDSSKFIPDFFFGASPSFTVHHSALTFFKASMNKADYNGDGVLTLRERAVYQMNTGLSPLGVLISKAGSKDMDIAGNPAKKPYFSKKVESIKSHDELMGVIENLRFGEQAMVLVEGRGGTPAKLKKWFRNEAAGGDGYYKFLMVKSSKEGRQYFDLINQPGIFAMGPNLRKSGVRLKEFEPIGKQMVQVLAKENALFVLRDWSDKIKKQLGWARENRTNLPIYDSVMKYLKDNPYFSIDDIVKEAKTLITSGDEDKQLRGLKLLKVVQESNGIDHKSIYPALHQMATPIINGDKAPQLKTLVLLIRNLGMLNISDAKKEGAMLIGIGMALYLDKFKDIARGAVGNIDVAQTLVPDLHSPDVVKQIEAINALAISGASIDSKESRHILSLCLDDGDIELRRAAAFFVSGERWQDPDKEKIWAGLRNEKDSQVSNYLLATLFNSLPFLSQEEISELEPRAKAVITDESSPKFLAGAAKGFITKLQARVEAEKRIREIVESRKREILGASAHLWGGYGLLGRHDNGTWTGGLAYYGGLYLKKGLFMDKASENIVSIGLKPGLFLSSHWKDTWFTSIGTAEIALEWRGKGDGVYFDPALYWRDYHNKHDDFSWILSGGYAARYMPVRAWDKVEHGWKASLNYLWVLHKDENDKIGPVINFFHFPSANDYIVTVGFKGILDL